MVCDAFNNSIINIAVRGVGPPNQNIRFGQPLFRQSMLGLLQGCGCRNDSIRNQNICNRTVHSLGIEVGNDLISLLVDVFTPNDNP
jgi:hypothetical protein